MGKYSKLNLPRILSTKPSKQAKVDLKKREILKNIPVRPQAAIFAQLYADVRRRKDKLKTELKHLEIEVEATKQLLVDQYEAEDIANLRLSSGDAVRIQVEPYTVIEIPTKFRLWCIENGYAESLSLPWSTTNALVKELILKGKPEPDGIRAYFLPKAVFSASKTTEDNDTNENDDDEEDDDNGTGLS